MGRSVVVVGASGLIGSAAVREFADNGWHVTAVSRRRPNVPAQTPYIHLPLDLLDSTATAEALKGLAPVSHLVYAAAFEKPGLVAGWSDPEQMQTNLLMLQNVLGPLTAAGSLEHVTTMQGTKAYGVHLHAIPIPARERYARDDHANFYWLQEDLLKSSAAQNGFGYTIFRPVQVVGPAYGVAYSTPPVIGAYAAICREEGLPFGFPGGNINPVRQSVDVELVAQAIRWAADAPTARGQHFNLTNGEVFSWQELWPSFAEVFGIEAAEPSPVSLGRFLPEHAETWNRIVRRYDLQPLSILDVVGKSHLYADYTFGFGVETQPPPSLVSTVAVKQAGFGEVRDTEAVYRNALESLIAQRVLPGIHPLSAGR
ncbi:NAD-dependent epimerase/dehydratase family protein [Subtercola endophyticus]|uniref:NAD-dependent epimerase/dehydratase family protein n=1 Tax=Subtercola endophyticus TaxID=2895559 RepID=UPI001E5DDB69|nr:NAD-dependent epimerase/dehydratase family protein [Subtercola endophyticus]UFS58315.1 NAD-dependent epimerase/dehydratase family protein [Subtercola endophyticus]